MNDLGLASSVAVAARPANAHLAHGYEPGR